MGAETKSVCDAMVEVGWVVKRLRLVGTQISTLILARSR
jgi:hypothetical protein